MTKERLVPSRRTPKRSEHFIPPEEHPRMISPELNPEERLMAKELGILEEPEGRTEIPDTTPDADLPEGIQMTQDKLRALPPNEPPTSKPVLGTPRENHREDIFAPVNGYHRRGGRFIAHESHGKHGKKPNRPKGGATT